MNYYRLVPGRMVYTRDFGVSGRGSYSLVARGFLVSIRQREDTVGKLIK